MVEGYQPDGPATNEVTPPNTGSHVRHPLMSRCAGIPVKEVGGRLLKLQKAIEEHGMLIGAEMDYHADMVGTANEQIRSATITVYFFE